MESMQRAAPGAAFLAAMALVWLFGGFLVSGLTPEDFGRPAKLLTFVQNEPVLFTAINLGGSVAASLLTMVVVLAVAERLWPVRRAAAEAGTVLTLIGLVGHTTDGLLRQSALSRLARTYALDPAGTVQSFTAVTGVIEGIRGLGLVGLGVGLIVLGGAMTASPRYRGPGYVGLAAGVASLLGVVLLPLGFLSGVLEIVWLLWTGTALSRDRT